MVNPSGLPLFFWVWIPFSVFLSSDLFCNMCNICQYIGHSLDLLLAMFSFVVNIFIYTVFIRYREVPFSHGMVKFVYCSGDEGNRKQCKEKEESLEKAYSQDPSSTSIKQNCDESRSEPDVKVKYFL